MNKNRRYRDARGRTWIVPVDPTKRPVLLSHQRFIAVAEIILAAVLIVSAVAFILVSKSRAQSGDPVLIKGVGSAAIATGAGAANSGTIRVAIASGGSSLSSTSTIINAFTPSSITKSSVTVRAGGSVQMFAGDSNRGDYVVFALPTNTDFIIGKWFGAASSTDTIILMPGQSMFPFLSVSTGSLNWTANSGTQVARGESYAR